MAVTRPNLVTLAHVDTGHGLESGQPKAAIGASCHCYQLASLPVSLTLYQTRKYGNTALYMAATGVAFDSQSCWAMASLVWNGDTHDTITYLQSEGYLHKSFLPDQEVLCWPQ